MIEVAKLPSWQKEAAIFGLFLLLSLLFSTPLVANIATTVHDPVDPLLNTWIIAWDQHALVADPAHLLDANIFHPYEGALLFSETLILPALLLLPFTLAGAGPVLIYNLFVLTGYTLTGFAGYLLGRWLFHSRGAGIVAGITLAFNPYMLSVLPKAQLAQFYWLPLALLYAGKLIRRPRPGQAVGLAGCLFAQFHTTVYYGFFAFLLVALTGTLSWLLHSRRRLSSFAGLATGIGGGLALSLPLGLAYERLSRQQGLVRTLGDAWPFSASLDMWRTPSPASLVYRWWSAPALPKVGFYPVEALFPGLVLLVGALLGLGWWLRRKERRWPLMLVLGMGIFFVLSLGPFLQIQSLQPDFGRELPYAVLHNAVPGFTALRAPVRFAVIVFLGLGLLAGRAVGQLRKPWQAVVIVLLFIEHLAPGSDAYVVPTRLELPPVYSSLAQQSPAPVVELPAYSPQLDDRADRWLAAQYASIYHWQITPAGYSGFTPPRHVELLQLLNRFPQQEALSLLQALNTRYIIWHTDLWPSSQIGATEAELTRLGLAMQHFGADRLIMLPASQNTGALPATRFHIPSMARAGANMRLDVVFTASSPVALPPKTPLGRISVEWRERDAQGQISVHPVLRQETLFQPPFYIAEWGLAPVHIPTPPAPGEYELTITAPLGDSVKTAVQLVEDIAPPEVTALPIQLVAASLSCGDAGVQLTAQMQTVGWYDEAFSLSAHVLNDSGAIIAQSDVEFPAYRPRKNLLEITGYEFPFLTNLSPGTRTINLYGYQWQQTAERTVPRVFIDEAGAPIDHLRFAVTVPHCP